MSTKNKLIVYPKLTDLKGWQPAFYWVRVSDNFSISRYFTKPITHMEDIPTYGLFVAEEKSVAYFHSELGIMVVDGEEAEERIPSTLLPNVKYILGNESLSALFLCQSYLEGVFIFSLGPT